MATLSLMAAAVKWVERAALGRRSTPGKATSRRSTLVPSYETCNAIPAHCALLPLYCGLDLHSGQQRLERMDAADAGTFAMSRGQCRWERRAALVFGTRIGAEPLLQPRILSVQPERGPVQLGTRGSASVISKLNYHRNWQY